MRSCQVYWTIASQRMLGGKGDGAAVAVEGQITSATGLRQANLVGSVVQAIARWALTRYSTT